MKVLFIDAKKVGLLTVTIMCMAFLFYLGGIFQTKEVVETVGGYKEYSINEGEIKYSLPEKWETNLRIFDGGEITYHNEFFSEDNQIRGFIQVWSKPNDLKLFLEESKGVAEKQGSTKNYNIKNTLIKEKEAYIVTYNVELGGSEIYSAYETFIKYKNGFLRVSFYFKKDTKEEEVLKEIDIIVNSLKMK
ncbi:hypothetical protein [Clostridium grantii]|uniref:PsbP protein n=1 Tax=Clostridium grantii DSM 8605 TaxID=1121316 RepID=A0A1M5XUZ7_9CLOT|nr:hypothetical protein [Clostridium grantii]SHI03368.1 hypothetical protein SAMN02745207_03941 [Clostridium grantii DSM 8605]